jgi:hypothetical protein
LDQCEYQLTTSLNKYLEELKRTISVSQLVGMASINLNQSTDAQIEELKQKLTSSSSAARKLDKMYYMSSNIVEKATRALNTNNENQLPIDKGFLDFTMDVSYIFERKIISE